MARGWANLLVVTAVTGCNPSGADVAPATPVSPETRPAEADIEPTAEEPAPDPSEDDEPEVPGGGPDPTTLDGEASTSIGSPAEGRLDGSVPLPLHGPGYRFDPRKPPQRRHGTVELVQALIHAAGAVHAELPGNTLTIGDLSMPEGSTIGGHASHRSGRDVDVMFYLLDESDQPFGGKPIPLEPDGTGHDYADLSDASDDVKVHIDVPRTWRFVQELLAAETVEINRIYVVEHIRNMLLEHARKIGAPRTVVERFGHVTCQPRFPHDDHMHIRVFCTPQDIEAGCLDTRPLYPWHLSVLRNAGVEPELAGRRKTKRPRLTSVTKAREKAAAKQELHPDVVAFLDRRKAWAKKPHPGRKYCR